MKIWFDKNGDPFFFAVDSGKLTTAEAMDKAKQILGAEKMAQVMGVSVRTIDNWRLNHRAPGRPALMLLKAHLDGMKTEF